MATKLSYLELVNFIISLLNCVPALTAVVADHGPLYTLPVVAPELAHLAAIRVP